MARYKLQVAGHDELLKIDGKLLKPVNTHEQKFYLDSVNTEIENVIPKNFGLYTKIKPQDERKNLLEEYCDPCVMDIKIGKRLYGKGASQRKREKMIHQSESTTSGSFGYRLCGMRKPFGKSVKIYTKADGKQYSIEELNQTLKEFFQFPNSTDSINIFVSKLDEIINIVSRTQLRLYSCSLLFFCEKDGSRPEIRIIDFAHSFFNNQMGTDENFLLGARNLSSVLHSFQFDKTVQESAK